MISSSSLFTPPLKKLNGIPVWVVICSFVLANTIAAQDTIYLNNPSFEDTPRAGSTNRIPIKGWDDCGLINFPKETPPDIHPLPIGAWDVTMPAHDGNTYLGMVTRYSNTYESVSQQLTSPMQPGQCYMVTAYLALSPSYNSATQRTRVSLEDGIISHGFEDFAHSIELVIWGGDASCKRSQELARSGPIYISEWTPFTFFIQPDNPYEYITLCALWEDGYTDAYNGHLLLDNLSSIIPISCDQATHYQTPDTPDTIYIRNASFEGDVKAGYASNWNLQHWEDCGSVHFPKASPPDVHGNNTNIWDVNVEPKDSNTFLGLVTRDDLSFESVSQKLSPRLKGGHCYTLTAHVRRAESYNLKKSHSKKPPVSFTTPATLRVWGGTNYCSRKEILFESAPINSKTWIPVNMFLSPERDISWISIEVYFKRDQNRFVDGYNGHVLLDALSPIVELKCQ